MDKIDQLITSPITQRLVGLLLRRLLLAAGPAASIWAQTAAGKADDAAALAEIAGWAITAAQGFYDAWRAAHLARREGGK